MLVDLLRLQLLARTSSPRPSRRPMLLYADASSTTAPPASIPVVLTLGWARSQVVIEKAKAEDNKARAERGNVVVKTLRNVGAAFSYIKKGSGSLQPGYCQIPFVWDLRHLHRP